ncbi:MAG: anti-sigma factor domain-containing protein [Chloroflexia bacterium]
MNSGPDNNETSDLEGQLAEYAFGVMEPSLALQLEQSLAECRDKVLLADQYAQAVGMLGYAVNPAEPPEGHKARFMSRLSSTEQAATQATGANAPRALPVRAQEAEPPAPSGVEGPQRPGAPVIDLSRERARRSRLALPLVATVAAALVLFVGAWGLSMKNSADTATALLNKVIAEVQAAPGSVAFPVQGKDQAANAKAFVLVNPKTNQATLFAQDLTQLSPAQVYEFWWLPQQQGAAPIAAGVFNSDANGTAKHQATAPLPVSSFAGVAVTIEATPGETSPKGPIVLVGTYSLP